MKVNILMSTYNGQSFLAQQIESIQQQTYQDWQLLIRDDGSSDETPAIIRQFQAADRRIRFINDGQNQNFGVIKSFYELVKFEPADFYLFADQDDIWLPEKIQMKLAEASRYDAQLPLMIYTDLTVVDQDLKVLTPSMVKSQSHHANTQLYQELTENTATGGVAMINHALAQKWESLEDIIMHDWYLALLASALGQLVYIDQVSELYRQHSSNVLGARTWSKRLKKWLRPHHLFQVYWELIKATQKQGMQLLKFNLKSEDRALIEAFATIMSQPLLTRIHLLRKFKLRKNKTFHTLVFSTLIITKFAYKE